MRRLILALAFFPMMVGGQQHCVAALLQDKTQLDLAESSSLALAMMVKRSHFAKSDWSGSLGIQIKGVPLEAGASRAKETTEDYFSNSNIEWSEKRIVSVATQTLSSNAVDAYNTCIQAHAMYGPRILVHSATRSGATVEIRWVSPPYAPTNSKADVFVSGAVLSHPFPTQWQTGVSSSRIVLRKPDKDFRITVDIGGMTASELVSAIPGPITQPPPKLVVGSCLGRGGFTGLRFWGPLRELCNGIGSWGAYDAQVQEVTELGWCLGKGGLNGVRLYGPVGASCAGVPKNGWGIYSNPIGVRDKGISSCIGHGSQAGGHRLWGPADESCGGIPAWDTYREFNVRSR
jgi:hypothetical protein